MGPPTDARGDVVRAFGHDAFPAWPAVSQAAVDAVTSALKEGRWWQAGDGHAERFEHYLAERQQVNHVVGVANGTLALEIGLRALGISDGDEVLVPALTF